MKRILVHLFCHENLNSLCYFTYVYRTELSNSAILEREKPFSFYSHMKQIKMYLMALYNRLMF